MNLARERLHVALLFGLVAILIVAACCSCGALKRSGLVGGGSALGAGAGLALGGPGGAIAGGAIGAMATSAVVEADATNDRAEALTDRLSGAPRPPPPPETPWYAHPWLWLLALLAWLKRAHLLDMLTGKNPRFDALLRTLGLRTSRTPVRHA
jgi:Outer membrane lipoprotein